MPAVSGRARDILSESRQCGALSQANCNENVGCEWQGNEGGKCDLIGAKVTQLCSVSAATTPATTATATTKTTTTTTTKTATTTTTTSTTTATTSTTATTFG